MAEPTVRDAISAVPEPRLRRTLGELGARGADQAELFFQRARSTSITSTAPGAAACSAASDVTVRARSDDGKTAEFPVRVRIDGPTELEYYRHGGILLDVLRSLLG